MAGLGEMLAITDETARKRKLIELEQQANQTHTIIKNMAMERRQNYRRLVNDKRREYQDVVTKLGGVSEEDMRAIQAIYGNAGN